MSHVCYDRVGDVERNIHYRTLAEIVGLADRGLKTGLNKKPQQIYHKVHIDSEGRIYYETDKIS